VLACPNDPTDVKCSRSGRWQRSMRLFIAPGTTNIGPLPGVATVLKGARQQPRPRLWVARPPHGRLEMLRAEGLFTSDLSRPVGALHGN